ncbi:hypothetical protein K2173_027440 [Erythroxylum novogranatense]|uniref:Symplekin n=1 Tax=Erythroxylum novogranatense TaxID=1862640 RepID=A0AAV8U2Y1_9ROSI|nr:hypothetical protein K2173_027440 [Erythroxylum novogranatense]
MASRDQALSLLAAANNHADLAVKLSSLKQVKDILFSVEPFLAAELFPLLVELQYSPEPLVRKMLVEIIGGVGLKVLEHCSILLHVLLAFLRDSDHVIVRQSIVCGTHFYCGILEKMPYQRGKVERWLEDLWIWMLKFKDAVFAIALEPSSVGTRLLALKFLETSPYFSQKIPVTLRNKQLFNISWLVGGHALLDPSSLMSDANRTLDTLLDFLHSPGHPGSLKIAVVNCLAAIARKRPVHYDRVLSALLSFDPNSDMIKSGHSASTRYSLKTAFLGFLRCTYPTIIESRDRLLKALRMMNAGDAADQVIRQVDKLIRNNERASRDARYVTIASVKLNYYHQDDQPSSQYLVSGEQFRKRSMPLENEEPANGLEVTSKRIRYGSEAAQVNINGSERDSLLANGVSCSVPLLDSDLTPAEQVSSVIEMIGVMLGEGEQGAESLKLLISRMDPEMLADIVVTNMKHLPKSPPSLAWPVTLQIGSPSSPTQIVTPSPPINQINNHPAAQLPISAATATNSPFSDLSTTNNSPADSKRDPRRDPRRLDPRRTPTIVGVTSTCVDDAGTLQAEVESSLSLNKSRSLPIVMSDDNAPAVLTSNRTRDDKSMVDPLVSEIEHVSPKEVVCSGAEEDILTSEVNASSEIPLSPHHAVDDESAASKFSDVELGDGAEPLSSMESDQQSPVDSNKSAPEDTCQELPQLPAYVELKEDELLNVRNLSVERIVESYRNLCMVDCSQTHMALLARLIAQIGTHDELIVKLQKHILVDYRQYKGHELVMHILYHLHSLMVPDTGNSSQMTVLYDKILLEVAKSLLDAFPASDKSFSRLLGEVPLLPPSAVKLLDDLCCSDVVDSSGKEVRDGGFDFGTSNHRQACLDIALKCAVHSQDDIRAKAVRLVANKLYQLDYITEHIEQFAVNMLLSAVNQQISDLELPQSGSIDQREGEVGNEEISVSGPQTLDTGSSENDSMRTPQLLVQSSSTISLPEAQRLISLFFALCTKKHSLLQLAFDAIHRHIPILIRALRSSFSELLRIISNPPEGCENLLMLVLQVLSQEMTPSSDLINTVKHLYETKLKDATILIPILSSLSKDEFQMAIAHILRYMEICTSSCQGSAHTGPALTPAEVLVAIHDISPEKDGLALKKITDACTACFEQRTVFTQQVLAKALNQMVDQTPLPLLLMRTIIQAIDAFPSLVDFVMEILSKLVSRQVWKMPKLWVGFLKCVSQTRPHSFHVLLQLPPPQLESALTKHANLRGPLASYASQPSIRTSIARSTLAVLGLADETQKQQPHVSPV